jgi:hypothetical protein
MRFLRTNTAVIVSVGPFYDKTDGVVIETALTITNERITLTADTDDGNAPTNILDNVTGATSGTSNDLNYITGNDAGMMQLELSAANTNRLGRMLLSITDAANHVPVFHEFMVLPAMIYDAFVSGTDTLDASVTQWLGTAASTPTVAGVPNVNAKTWNDLATVALPLVPTTAGRTLDISTTGEAGVDWANVGSPTTTLNLSGTSTKAVEPTVAGRTLDVSAGGEAGVDWANVGSPTTSVGLSGTTVGTLTTYTGNTVQTGDAYARIGAAGVSLSAIPDLAGVTTLLSRLSAARAGYLDNVNNATLAGASFPTDPADESLVIAATDALAAAIAALNNLSQANIRTAVGLASANLDTQLGAIDDYLDTEVAAIKAKTDLLPASPAATGDAMTLTSGERTSIADALLKRDWSAVTGEAARSMLNALRFLRNKWSVSGTTLTVTTEDDTTAAWTSTVTVDATAAPVTGSDPA